MSLFYFMCLMPNASYYNLAEYLPSYKNTFIFFNTEN